MRNPYRNPFFTEDRTTEAGSITVPLLLLSVVLGGAVLSTLVYSMSWRSKAALQLRLDRCVEATSLDLLDIQTGIESSNFRMNSERIAAVTASAPTFGQSINAVKIVLAAEVAFQETLRMRWRAKQARWILNRGCDKKADLFFPLPGLAWERPPPDSIGLLPLDWKSKSDELQIRLWKGNRFTQARVNRHRKGIRYDWHASWISRTTLSK